MSTQPAAGIIPEWSMADRLRKARELTGLDQTQFADEIGVSRTSVNNAENGHNRPRGLTLRAWAMRTGVDASWLATGESDTPPGGPGGQSTDYGYAQVVALRVA